MVSRRSTAATAAHGALATLGARTGCGVPADSTPRVIADEATLASLLPPSEREPTATTTAGMLGDEVTGEGVLATVPVALVRDDRLVTVRREGGAGIAGALTRLLEGPTAQETERGITTLIPPGTGLLGIAEAGGVVTVDVTGEFLALQGEGLLIAVAQLVATTFAADPVVTGVFVAVDGEVRVVPTDDGDAPGRPLTRADYDAYGA